jgi:ABC-type cobalamin/Fe3+-siderophores transport system ATPase subunit
MKITEVNLIENITNQIGLKPISMKKIGDMVLLAGKNGSGKTRLLNLVRNHTQNVQNDINQRNNAKNNLDSYSNQIKNLPRQKQQLEEGIVKYKEQIKSWEQLIENQPNQKQRIEPNIKSYESNIINWNKQIENQPKQKKEWEREILKFEEQLNNPIPIIFENNQQNVAVIDFVPNRIELEDWANQSKQGWMQKANLATTPGVAGLYQTTIPLIQKVVETWFNTTHPMAEISKEDKKKATIDYERLQSIIKSFIGTEIGWNKDGYSTLFAKPIAEANLSAGQSVLLQLCVAIFAQGGNLSNYIIFMDEPENHLHPSAVIDLLDTIREHNPNGQIWIATHSIPLLSHFDASSLWFVEDGDVKHSGKKPELVLRSLLGDEDRIQKLRDFTSLPSELARNRFTFECLCPPLVVETDSSDPQSKQLNEQLNVIWNNKSSINLLDFGAGKGRMIANLSDYPTVSKETLNYHAFEPFNTDKDDCLKNIALCYEDAENRYHTSIENLRTKVDDNYFDVVVLSNVLHEIPHSEWLSIFPKIKQLLKSDGYLLLIEDCLIPIGELPHNNGFIVFNTLHLKKLFKILSSETNFIEHDARFDSIEQRGRLMAHLIPQSYLSNISTDTIKEALKELKQSAKTKIQRIRKETPSYSNGLAHGFWIQQLANAELCLEEL